MPLQAMTPVLERARAGNYAVGAFNVCNLEYAKAVVETAARLRSPVIVALHPVEIAYGGLGEMTAIVRSLAENVDVPVALHLDHGASLAEIAPAMAAGFTSVMLDASGMPFEDNVAATAEMVRFAHAMGIDVEAELGLVGGAEGDAYAHKDSVNSDLLTDPKQAKEFVRRTGVDSLAVAIGTAHGFYSGTPRIDLDRLSRIREEVDVPLVLHGGSGTGDGVLREAVSRGIAKINIATELKYAFHRGLVEGMRRHPEAFEPRTILPYGIREGEALVEQKMRLFGSAGQA